MDKVWFKVQMYQAQLTADLDLSVKVTGVILRYITKMISSTAVTSSL